MTRPVQVVDDEATATEGESCEGICSNCQYLLACLLTPSVPCTRL